MFGDSVLLPLYSSNLQTYYCINYSTLFQTKWADSYEDNIYVLGTMDIYTRENAIEHPRSLIYFIRVMEFDYYKAIVCKNSGILARCISPWAFSFLLMTRKYNI